MVYASRQWVLSLVLTAVLAGLPGCFGVSQNPSYFPYLLPTGDIIRTHAKPGFGYYSNFDPHACRLEVRPLESTNPVRTQHVLIATVYDDKGEPRRHRRVEWIIEGVGNIVEVDESGFYPGRGYKVDNKYAVSYTDYKEHRISRGNANPNDDFVIRPGQTWCVISSGVEGDTHVTAYAPEIANWDQHKVFITKHWVDAEWAFPPPAVARAGGEFVFATNVFRHTDRQPLANYRVRYRILDGPPSVLLPGRTQEAVAISDLSGNASITIAQPVPAPGLTRIGIEVIRPPDPTSPSGAGIIIGRGETAIEWQGPSITLTKMGPPTAAVNQEIMYTIAITNGGRVESQAQTVRDAVPEGLQYLRSEPVAIAEGNQLTWTLGALPSGQTQTLRVYFRSLRVGPITNCANVTTIEGLRAENCVTTQITAPQLTLAPPTPITGVVGLPVALPITISNPGNGPATNVVLTANYDKLLEHESKANPLELKLGTLAPGETRPVPLTLIPRQAGRLLVRVTASADGGLKATGEYVVTAQAARVEININGPAAKYVERPAIFDIHVVNPNEVLLSNVMVRAQLPPELAFTSATLGGQLADNQVVWSLGAMQPREQKMVQVTTRCQTIATKVVPTAVVSADPGVQAQAQAVPPLEIRGLPAFRLQVVDVTDPVEVGGKTSYKIDVTNQGSLPGNKVQIIATLPPQMRFLNSTGPAKPQVKEQQVIFPLVDGLLSKQTLSYTVEVEALKPGDVRFKVELRADTLTEPVLEEESTNIYVPVPGAGNTPGPSPNPPMGPPSTPPT